MVVVLIGLVTAGFVALSSRQSTLGLRRENIPERPRLVFWLKLSTIAAPFMGELVEYEKKHH